MMTANKIQTAVQQQPAAANPAKQSITAMMNSILDSEGYRKRFDDLLGERAAQFVSSIVSLVNATPQLQKAFYEAPVTVVQAALKAATYDLPIDPALGYAYIVPFNNRQSNGIYRMEATFVMGYRGMVQLALRTGAYKTINVVDVRQGELKHFDRLTEEINLQFVEDEAEREGLPIVGWCGYFRLVNGAEKTIYMTKEQVAAHERRHRKGKNMSKGWLENFDVMASKTVLRQLLGKWGLMSISYQRADQGAIEAAKAIAEGEFDGKPDMDVTTEYSVYAEAGMADGMDEALPFDDLPEDGTHD
jgi:recombination protein RecT